MQSKIELQTEINTQNIVKPVSYYKNYAVSPIGAVPTSLTINSNPQVTFELPADSIINFSRLIFSFYRGANVAGTNPLTHTVDQRVVIPANYMPFLSRVEVYSGSGNLKLLDLNNADIYSKASAHLMNDFLKNVPSNGLLYPKKAMNDTAGNPGDFLINSPTSNPNAALKTAYNVYQNYEMSSLTADTFEEGFYNYRLGDCYPDTIFNLNKSIYIAKSIFIRFTFNSTNKFVNIVARTTGVPAALPATVTLPISNLSIKTYTENDPLIIEQVKNQARNGVSYVMPDVIVNQLSISGAGTKGLQTKYSNMTGNSDSRLYKCYSILNSTGASAALYNLPTSNIRNGKYNYLSLFVNSQNILNFDVTSLDDIQHMIIQHENHSLVDDSTVKDNGVICNVFDSSPCKKDYSDDELKGLAFGQSGDITINWQYTIAPSAANAVSGDASYDNYQFGIILRRLFARDGMLSTTAF